MAAKKVDHAVELTYRVVRKLAEEIRLRPVVQKAAPGEEPPPPISPAIQLAFASHRLKACAAATKLIDIELRRQEKVGKFAEGEVDDIVRQMRDDPTLLESTCQALDANTGKHGMAAVGKALHSELDLRDVREQRAMDEEKREAAAAAFPSEVEKQKAIIQTPEYQERYQKRLVAMRKAQAALRVKRQAAKEAIEREKLNAAHGSGAEATPSGGGGQGPADQVGGRGAASTA